MKHTILVATAGLLALQSTAQNVGIGTTAPTEGKLVVTGGIGGTQAVFGVGANGIAIQSNPAAINFNNYFGADGRKLLSTGYAGQFAYNADIGSFTFNTSSASGTGGAATSVGMSLLTLSRDGNVGIRTTGTSLGRLVVYGREGAVSAMFQDNTGGVSIMNSAPSIGFNYYFNGGAKSMNTGYGASVGMYDNTGQFFIATSATSATGQGTAMPLTERFIIKPNGNIGIAFADPTATLTVGRGTAIGGTLRIDGTNNVSHFNIGADEHTYIRGGKAASNVYINDAGTGNIIMAQTGGNVGIGVVAPASKLDVNGRIRIRQTTVTAGIGFDGKDASNNPQIDRGFIGMADNNYVGFYGSGGAGWGMAMNVNNGNVGIGTTTPASRLTVKDNFGFAAAAEIIQDGAGGGLRVTSNGPTWATLGVTNNGTGPAIATGGRVAVNTSSANSTLQVAGSLSMPYKVVTDHYTVTDNDYSVRFITTQNTNYQRVIALPSAVGKTGRIYVISAEIPVAGPSEFNGISPTVIYVQDPAQGNIALLQNYISTYDGSFKKRTIVEYFGVTVQSDGSVWKIIARDRSYSDDTYDW